MARQLRLKLRRPVSFRRDDFIVSTTNAEAVRTVDAWPAWFGGCLALIGPSGSGKTHLGQSWAAQVGALVIEPKHSRTNELMALRGRPILIDDADQGVADETLFHLINMAGEPGAGLLLIAKVAPQAWTATLPDLRSRLKAMSVAELPPPDDTVLEGLLSNFFRERSITPREDLIPYLLKRIERSAVSAREIVDRLEEASIADQKAVNRALARQFFEIEGETLDIDE